MQVKSLCGCDEKHGVCKKIVVTGGPGAGKTAVLEMARRVLCHHVAILPESASIIFGGGFWREEGLPAKKAAQRAIFHVQREMEHLVDEDGKYPLALCDRGTLDGLAYWPIEENIFFKELGTTLQREIAKYDVVIHLRTPPSYFGYNHTNPLRVESVKEALLIDKKIEKVWQSHPHRHFIDSTENFMEKSLHALRFIKKEIPKCCVCE